VCVQCRLNVAIHYPAPHSRDASDETKQEAPLSLEKADRTRVSEGQQTWMQRYFAYSRNYAFNV